MKEAKIETFVVKGVEAAGGVCMKFVSPGRRGVSDRIVLMPGGRIWWVELKRPSKTLEPLQRIFRKMVIAFGFKHRKIDSIELAKQFIYEING